MANLTRTTVLFLFICASFAAVAQRTVTGRILDSETKKPVEAATVISLGTTNGTVTNKLGFFSYVVKASDTVFVLSRMGYETSKVSVPKTNQFSVLMRREYLVLPVLELDNFVLTELPPNVMQPALVAGTEAPADYPGGWLHLSNHLAKTLAKEENITAVQGTTDVKFTVNEKGKVRDVSVDPVGDSTFMKLMTVAFDSTQSWTPASQFGTPVSQYFILRVVATKGKNPETGEIFTKEIPAEPRGGIKEFYRYVGNEMKYPPQARTAGVQGKVFVEFVIQKDGSISDIKVVKGIGYGCDEEAVRVVSTAPNWKPGATQKGEPVVQRMVMPITFSLGFTPAKSEYSFQDYLTGVIPYPARARRENIGGWVFVKAVIDGANRITDVQIVRDIGGGCGEEVANAVLSAPSVYIEKINRKSNTVIIPVKFIFDNTPDLNVPVIAGDNTQVLQPVNIIGNGVEREVRVIGLPAGVENFKQDQPGTISVGATGFSPEQLKSLPPRTKRITSVGRKYTEVPEVILTYSSVVVIDLENNEISKLPDNINQLKDLGELYMPANKLTELPASLSSLKKLKILALGGNKFAAWPMVICEISSLQALDLATNSITSVPPEVAKLKNLETLFLTDNNISTLPEEFYTLKNLKKLDLQGNPFSVEEQTKIRTRLPKVNIRF